MIMNELNFQPEHSFIGSVYGKYGMKFKVFRTNGENIVAVPVLGQLGIEIWNMSTEIAISQLKPEVKGQLSL